jgi:hypothetical protein
VSYEVIYDLRVLNEARQRRLKNGAIADSGEPLSKTTSLRIMVAVPESNNIITT